MTEHLGPYELRGELGRGAMAVVWRGFDPKPSQLHIERNRVFVLRRILASGGVRTSLPPA